MQNSPNVRAKSSFQAGRSFKFYRKAAKAVAGKELFSLDSLKPFVRDINLICCTTFSFPIEPRERVLI